MDCIKEKYFVVGDDEFYTQLITKKYGDRWSCLYNNFFDILCLSRQNPGR